MQDLIKFPAKKQPTTAVKSVTPKKLFNIAESIRFKGVTIPSVAPKGLSFAVGVDKWPFSAA
ncbi:MAG: hypothetical protein ABSF22_05800 [Bryobacteraceae bacterium]